MNKYGFSHVCALQEFQNIAAFQTAFEQHEIMYTLPYNFPSLDIYLYDASSYSGLYTKIEFYYRGTKDRNLKFKNLFEYLLSTAVNGQGYILLINPIFRKIREINFKSVTY